MHALYKTVYGASQFSVHDGPLKTKGKIELESSQSDTKHQRTANQLQMRPLLHFQTDAFSICLGKAHIKGHSHQKTIFFVFSPRIANSVARSKATAYLYAKKQTNKQTNKGNIY